ncbi:MAG: hypothetical protein R2806_07745 [Saprospiraceae bacterium]
MIALFRCPNYLTGSRRKYVLRTLLILSAILAFHLPEATSQIREILHYRIVRKVLKKETLSGIEKWIDTLPEEPEIDDRYGPNDYAYQIDSSYFRKFNLRSLDVLAIYLKAQGDTILGIGVEIRQSKRFFQSLMKHCRFVSGYSTKTRKIPVEMHYNYFQILSESRWRNNHRIRRLAEPTFTIKHYRPATGFIQNTKYPYFSLLIELSITPTQRKG